MYDVTIIGAGLAGLQLARLLARSGAKVFLADARRSVSESIRTTGIFVRRTFADFPSLDTLLGPPIRSIAMHSPRGRRIDLTSARDEFRVGRMKPLYEAMLAQCLALGVEWSPATTYASTSFGADCLHITFRDGRTIRTRFLAGADGHHSAVARDLGLDQNHRWITGVETIHASRSPNQPRFDCWIDPAIAPGYLAWVVDDGEEMHVGVGGDRTRFDPFRALAEFSKRNGIEDTREHRGGLIPVNGILRRIANRRGLLVGDAAGAVSPLTAGGLDACMRLSEHAARALLDALHDRAPLDRYSGAAYRSRFASRLLMRTLFDLVTRSPRAIEAGFIAAKTALASPLVRHVFFGRGSFPDSPAGHDLAEASLPDLLE